MILFSLSFRKVSFDVILDNAVLVLLLLFILQFPFLLRCIPLCEDVFEFIYELYVSLLVILLLPLLSLICLFPKKDVVADVEVMLLSLEVRMFFVSCFLEDTLVLAL
jgi:hypothetical protein